MYGIILQGGGSKGAYQTGFLLALSEILPNKKMPFTSISGVSVGAINATILAMEAKNFRKGTLKLKNYWLNLRHDDVYDIGKYGILSSWSNFFSKSGHDSSLFENRPLTEFLEPKLDWQAIHNQAQNIFNPTYLNIHAYSYTNSKNIIFTNQMDLKGERYRPTQIGVEHVIASSSLPYIFPGTKIGKEVFADGGFQLQQLVDIQIKQGCKKILGISLDSNTKGKSSIVEHLFEAIFPDAISTDFKKIEDVNRKIPRFNLFKNKHQHIETALFRPSKENFPNKGDLIDTLPKSLSYFSRMLGLRDNPDSNIINYIVFAREYTHYLISQGYEDAMAHRSELEAFFDIQ